MTDQHQSRPPLHIAITYQPKSTHCTSPMNDSPPDDVAEVPAPTTEQPRPPLWREMNAAQMALGYPLPQEMAYSDAIAAMHAIRAAEIRAMADAIPEEFYGANGVKAWLLNEAKRAEEGE